jgi:cytochrome c556
MKYPPVRKSALALPAMSAGAPNSDSRKRAINLLQTLDVGHTATAMPLTYKRRFIKQTMLFMIAVIFTAAGVATRADADDDSVAPLALRAIMGELSKNMQTATHAVSREDWEQAAKTALRIADHPQPPMMEKLRILSFAGSDVQKFKNFNRQTSLAAKYLEEVAGKQDGHAVIAAFAALQSSCLACHQDLRKPFKEHFYGTQIKKKE